MITLPVTWAKLHEELPTITSLNADECVALATAYTALEERFGVGVFADDHPFLAWIWEGGPISRRRWLRLHDLLQHTATAPNAAPMLRKLTQNKEARKTLDVLDWWGGLVAAGCTAEFEPALPGLHRQADLLITAPQKCYVELTELEPSLCRTNLRATHHLLIDMLHGNGLPLCYAGRFQQAVPSSAWPELSASILHVRRRAEAGAIATLERPDGLVLGVAPGEQCAALVAWATAHHLKVGQILSPPFPAMETHRIQRKIQDKARRQLPRGTPGILVLYSNEIYLQDAKLLETLQVLIEEVQRWPQISALVLTSLFFYLDPTTPLLTATHEGHRIITRDNGWNRQCTLLIYNPKAADPLPQSLHAHIERHLTTVFDHSEPYGS